MKKCLVLDLDNTLWGGVIGEDGMEGIALSVASPGNSFLAFQQAILDHFDKGIILAINSRNNEEDAMNVIRNHPNMLLKEHHFAAKRINWNDKAENIREIAQELNIGLDSLVFLDDDITNRELVRALVPEVEVPELPVDPKEYTKFLHALPYFKGNGITDEDKMRGNLYVTERLRREEEKRFKNKEDFLYSLGLELTVSLDDDSSTSRLSQLTEKTNQFNSNKKPLSEEEIRKAIISPNRRVFYGKLHDVFGDYGIIIFALVDIQDDYWNIESLLMSCRVFGRSVEDAFLSVILQEARLASVKKVRINYTPSEKNAPAKEFINKYFEDGYLDITQEFSKPNWINIL